jgi:hypothetical protein
LLPEFLEQLVSFDHDLWEGIRLLGFRILIFWRGSGSFRSVFSLHFSGRPHRKILGGFGRHF